MNAAKWTARGTRATVESLPPRMRRSRALLLLVAMAIMAWAPILLLLWLIFR